MNICMWLGGSLEEWCSSYHLLTRLAQEIIEAGHELWLIQAQHSTGKVPKELESLASLHVINVPQPSTEKSSFLLRYIREYQYFMRSGKYFRKIKNIDVVFLQSNNVAILPVTIAIRKHIPVLYNVQDVFPLDAMVIGKLSNKNPAYLVAKFLQAKAYKKATRVVTISEDLAKTIRKEGRPDVDVIYNWSYQNEPYNITDDNNHFLVANNIKRNDGFRVVYAGNVGQMMENEMIVQSAKILKEYKDIKFYIIGSGSGLKRLKARVNEEGLVNVLFYGFQPMEYAQDNYCAADVNINPVPKGVIFTCMPSKTATCLLSEQPTVISMDLDSDMAKRLKNVDQWTIINPGDAQAMADAILKVYKRGSQKSKNAAKFLQELGPVENAKKYVRILENIKNL